MSASYCMIKLRGTCAEQGCERPSKFFVLQIAWRTEDMIPYELCQEHADTELKQKREEQANIQGLN